MAINKSEYNDKCIGFNETETELAPSLSTFKIDQVANVLILLRRF